MLKLTLFEASTQIRFTTNIITTEDYYYQIVKPLLCIGVCRIYRIVWIHCCCL